MMKTFASNTICIDSTHCTNQYDFPLTTLMIIDEFGEGIPVAFMISNRETGAVVEAFYQAIKSRVGIISPKIFMTDDAPQYFSAWQKQFGENSQTKKLLCRWHLDKTWRRAIQEKVARENQPEVYRHMLVLLHESIPSEFSKKLQSFLTYLREGSLDSFLEYFQQNYCTRIDQWATHARCYTNVNTNMHIEAFHRLVKTVYFQQKQNRRVDALLNVLLKLCRDKTFERLRKTEKGKNTHRLCDINKRNKTAEEIGSEHVKMISNDLWCVNSQHHHNCYTIKRSLENANCSCPLKCSHCGVCVHMYSCTCLDSILHSTVCKHVHLVHMRQQQNIDISEEQATNSNETDHAVDGSTKANESQYVNPSDLLDYSTNFCQYLELDNSDRTSSSESLMTTCKEIQEIIPNVSNISAIKAASKSMRSVLSLLRASLSDDKVRPLQPKRKYAANTNHEKQQRFHSTKKKTSASSRWSKPTFEEQVSICNKLSSIEIKFCGVCFKEDDDDTECPYNQWDKCNNCDMWIHKNCSTQIAGQPFCQLCSTNHSRE